MLRTLRNHLLQIRTALQRRDRQRRAAAQQRGGGRALPRASRPASTRRCPATARPAVAEADAGVAAALEAVREPGRGRGAARPRQPDPRGAAHELLPAPRAARHLDQGGQPQGRGHALAAADVRDLRALAPAGGHPPARRQGGARRHPLERPPRRLPHRDPGPDEDPDGQELDHRAGRLARAASCSRATCRRAPRSTPT